MCLILRNTIKKVKKLVEVPITLLKFRNLKKMQKYRRLDLVLYCWRRKLLRLLGSGIMKIRIRKKLDFWSIIEISLKMEWPYQIKINLIFSKSRMLINLKRIMRNGFNFIHSKFKFNRKKIANQTLNHFHFKINLLLWKKWKFQIKKTSKLQLKNPIKHNKI